MGILDFIFSVIFNFVAVVMVWRTNDSWVDCGVILLQVFFICYQIYKNVENK
jgi:uncharacterized membrane protein